MNKRTNERERIILDLQNQRNFRHSSSENPIPFKSRAINEFSRSSSLSNEKKGNVFLFLFYSFHFLPPPTFFGSVFLLLESLLVFWLLFFVLPVTGTVSQLSFSFSFCFCFSTGMIVFSFFSSTVGATLVCCGCFSTTEFSAVGVSTPPPTREDQGFFS
jgi:hypothetical protein